jgi:DNA mismatch endonuclease (patch repair protein)
MSRVKSANTGPELKLRRALWARGLRYRVNVKSLPGKPDIVFTRAKIAVFCDGDFWHGHRWAIKGLGSLEKELQGYSPYWRAKIQRNVQRDLATSEELTRLNWRVLRFWASEIDANVQKCVDLIVQSYREWQDGLK